MSVRRAYVLGAGFSHRADFPLQAEILPRIRAFEIDLMSAPRHSIDEFENARNEVGAFVTKVFGRTREPPLEDLFTLLDHTIAARGHCAGYDWQHLELVREALKRTILFVFHSAGLAARPTAQRFYRSFAAHLLQERAKIGQPGDASAILSLNWDSLIEDSLWCCIRKVGAKHKVDVNYCCDVKPLRESSPHTPSMVQHAMGLYDIRVMKLHGSVNWLTCPNCGDLFTGLGSPDSTWEQYARAHPCPSCVPPGGPGTGSRPPFLQPFLVMPTFLKLLDNPHLQMTWQAAFRELAAAHEVVFIGYSLPHADFHFRTLLHRAVSHHAKIIAVLVRSDDVSRNTPLKLRHRGLFAAERYRDFFGDDRVQVLLGGLEAYFARPTSEPALAGQLASLRRTLHIRAPGR